MEFRQRMPFIAFCILVMTFTPLVAGQKLNVLCLLEHCGVEMYECVSNSTCRKAITCFGGCGTDLPCTMQCLYSYGYEDQQFYKFFSCATVHHKCIAVAPSSFNCTKPQKLAQNFNFNMLKGQWYSVRGKTPQDCYDCYSVMYVPYQNGTLAMRSSFDTKTATEEPTANPAIWKSSGSSVDVKGLFDVNEEWRAVTLALHGATLLTYYCGNSTGTGYEGMMLFSRTQSLSSGDYQAAKAAAMALGYDLDKFCALDQLHCSGRY